MGVPGAGKSTLRTRMMKVLAREGYQVFSPEDALISALKSGADDSISRLLLMVVPNELLRNHLYAIFNWSNCRLWAQSRFLASRGRSLQAFLGSRQYQAMSFDDRYLALSRFFKLVALYQLVEEEMDAACPVVFDSGFLQKAMGLFLMPGAGVDQIFDNNVSMYLENIPMPDLLIWVDTDIELCQERLTSRPRGAPLRMGNLDQDDVLIFLNACHKYFERAAESVTVRGGRVIRIMNNDELEKVIQDLSKDMLRMVSANLCLGS